MEILAMRRFSMTDERERYKKVEGETRVRGRVFLDLC